MTPHPCRFDEPTCHDCNHYGYEECPYYPNEATLEGSACIRHPRARDYLMQDVIAELERRKTKFPACGTIFNNGYRRAADEAIALIKGGE